MTTGTGTALLLDGQDAALVRLSVVDTAGRLVPQGPPANVTFSVVSGPGRVIGVGNGDPTSHERNKATWRTTHPGLARAVVQVSDNAATPDRARQAQIDLEGGIRTSVHLADGGSGGGVGGGTPIVVRATAAGFATVEITIPTSTTLIDGVMAVASRSVNVDLSID